MCHTPSWIKNFTGSLFRSCKREFERSIQLEQLLRGSRRVHFSRLIYSLIPSLSLLLPWQWFRHLFPFFSRTSVILFLHCLSRSQTSHFIRILYLFSRLPTPRQCLDCQERVTLTVFFTTLEKNRRCGLFHSRRMKERHAVLWRYILGPFLKKDLTSWMWANLLLYKTRGRRPWLSLRDKKTGSLLSSQLLSQVIIVIWRHHEHSTFFLEPRRSGRVLYFQEDFVARERISSFLDDSRVSLSQLFF